MLPDFTNYRAIVAWYYGRDRHVNQWDRMENKKLTIHGHLL